MTFSNLRFDIIRLKVYVHEDAIALIAMEDYVIPQKEKPTPNVEETQQQDAAQQEQPEKTENTGQLNKASRNARKRANRKKNQRDRKKRDEEEMPELSTYGHITNSCLQRDHPNFDEDATVRLLSELSQELGEEVPDQNIRGLLLLYNLCQLDS